MRESTEERAGEETGDELTHGASLYRSVQLASDSERSGVLR